MRFASGTQTLDRADFGFSAASRCAYEAFNRDQMWFTVMNTRCGRGQEREKEAKHINTMHTRKILCGVEFFGSMRVSVFAAQNAQRWKMPTFLPRVYIEPSNQYIGTCKNGVQIYNRNFSECSIMYRRSRYSADMVCWACEQFQFDQQCAAYYFHMNITWHMDQCPMVATQNQDNVINICSRISIINIYLFYRCEAIVGGGRQLGISNTQNQ